MNLRTRGKWQYAAFALTAVLGGGATADSDAQASRHGSEPRTLHVATWGSDRWPGTERHPFATVARAQRAVRSRTARMRSDLVVEIHRGTYRLTAPLRLSEAAGDSGENGHRVIYRARGYGTRRQEDVVLSGGRTISAWRRPGRDGDVWQARVGSLETRQLFVGGKRAQRASLGTGLPGTVTTTDTGYVTDSMVPQSWANPQDIEFSYGYKGTEPALYFTEPRCGVADITGDAQSTTIVMDQPCFRRARTFYSIEWDGALTSLIDPTSIENSPSFLAEPGTFYLDRSRPGDHVLSYRPRPGEDPRRTEVVAPVLETLLEGKGSPGAPLHDVAFKGLTFAHATWLEPSRPEGFVHFFMSGYEAGDPPGDDFVYGEGHHVPGNVAFHTADRILLEGNRFRHLGGVGLEFSKSSSANVIRGNEIGDVSQTGLLIGVLEPDVEGTNRGNVVENNWIHDVGVEYHGGGGMFLYKLQDTVVRHNQVNDIAYSGITVAGQYLTPDPTTRGAQIIGNRVFNTLEVLSDGGGIYLAGPQGSSPETGSVVRGNVVHDSVRPPNIGIYTDQGTNYGTIESNVIYRNQYVFGGCSFDFSQVENVLISGNFSDREDYIWSCGATTVPSVLNHTVLGAADPEAACAAITECAAIEAAAGLEPAYRHVLDG